MLNEWFEMFNEPVFWFMIISIVCLTWFGFKKPVHKTGYCRVCKHKMIRIGWDWVHTNPSYDQSCYGYPERKK